MKATEVKDKHFRLLIMSPYGAGKTYMIGLIHNLLKEAGTKGLYLFDFDAGVNTLGSAGFDVEFDHYLDSKDELMTGFERFQSKYTQFETNMNGFGGIAMDSLSMMQRSIMKYVHRINKVKRQLGFLSNRNDYGVQIDILTQMFPQFLSMSKKTNIIMTCHTKERERVVPNIISNIDPNVVDSQAVSNTVESVEVLPAIVGKSLPTQLGMWFNEVWYLKVDANQAYTKRQVQTGTDDEIHCKTQIAGMPFITDMEDAIKRLAKAYEIVKKPVVPTTSVVTPLVPKT